MALQKYIEQLTETLQHSPSIDWNNAQEKDFSLEEISEIPAFHFPSNEKLTDDECSFLTNKIMAFLNRQEIYFWNPVKLSTENFYRLLCQQWNRRQFNGGTSPKKRLFLCSKSKNDCPFLDNCQCFENEELIIKRFGLN